MRTYELLRTVSVGQLTIRLWLDANDGPCDQCQQSADEIAMCAATLADAEDEPLALAERLANTLNAIVRVEVQDDEGNGGAVCPRVQR